ncbi:MAG: HIRAN domain-containing protein [Acidobacteriaceae bacterium]
MTPQLQNGEAPGKIYHGAGYTQTPDDIDFNEIVERVFGDALGFGYYLTVAGASHRNADGTNRRRIIGECDIGELLYLRREPENAYDANAVAVERFEGGQLGYLPARSAAEVSAAPSTGYYLGVLRLPTIHPEMEKVAGALMVLLYLNKREGYPEFDASWPTRLDRLLMNAGFFWPIDR